MLLDFKFHLKLKEKKIISKRIRRLEQSPCYQCGFEDACNHKIRKIPRLEEICDMMFEREDLDYHDCGIWIALNAPEMIEVDE